MRYVDGSFDNEHSNNYVWCVGKLSESVGIDRNPSENLRIHRNQSEGFENDRARWMTNERVLSRIDEE